MRILGLLVLNGLCALGAAEAYAAHDSSGDKDAHESKAVQVTVYALSEDPKGEKKKIGTVAASDTKFGLLLTPDLAELKPGPHGFHVHEHGSCDHAENKDTGKMAPGQAAGGHLDPQKTGKHSGPYSEDGHLGDLPVLYVSDDGKAATPVLAPRLKTSDLKGHALMIHAGGDNYSDEPAKLGGGGARVACGTIE